MTQDDSKAVIQKVRKLLAMASDGSGAEEAEIEQALARARELMTKHGLEMSEIEPPEQAVMHTWTGDRRAYLPQWHSIASSAVGHVCDVKSIESTDENGRVAIVFLGAKSDVQVAAKLYVDLIAIIRSMAKERYGRVWSKLHRSYAIGFAVAMEAKASKWKQQAVKDGSAGAQIVLRKGTAIDRFLEDCGITLGESKRRSSDVDPAAYRTGLTDGSEADMNPGDGVTT